MEIAVLYHDDADGFGAAFALWMGFDRDDSVLYLPVQYGQPVPDLPDTVRELFIVDFSYDRATCEALAAKYKLAILDHHKTAAQELAGLAFATFDQERSGAVLAWEYMFSGDYEEPVPEILQYVQDRDLWRFELPFSDEVNLYIASMDRSFSVWANFDFAMAVAAGTAIRRFRDKQIRGALRDARVMPFFGHEVPVVNCTANISEIAAELLKAYGGAPFAVMYCDGQDGQRRYSLRSRGDFDVADLCRRMGGGGHAAAAGFKAAALLF